jgi:hypothetical protein
MTDLAQLPSPPPPPSKPPFWKFWEGSSEIVLARSTVLLTIATILLAVMAAIQAYILATTDNSTRMSADAAVSSAATAKATLDASSLEFRQEQRPYLWASSFNISNPSLCVAPGGTRVCADVHIVNSGRTPAIGVRLHRYVTFGAKAENTVKAMKIQTYPSPAGDMLGTIGDKWGTAATDLVDDATAKGLIDGTISLFVYGIVQYYDIFGDYHETGFCSHKLPDNGPFIVCDGGNWLDKRK